MLYKYVVLKNNICIIKNHLLFLDYIIVALELIIKGYTYVLISFFLKLKYVEVIHLKMLFNHKK